MPTEPSDLLRAIHIFAGLNEEALGALANLCREMQVEPGTVIVEQDAPGREMYLIGSGKVAVVRKAKDGHTSTLAVLEGGDFFGEMCIIECMPRSASVSVVEPSLLYALKGADIFKLFKLWPDQCAILMLNISRDLCRRLRALEQVI
jgi:CRP-like cAMP-binding protein